MSEHAKGKERPAEERDRERALKARTEQQEQPTSEDRRKPSPVERREWRGSGVCGDRHTD
jgi:hypothetical protein